MKGSLISTNSAKTACSTAEGSARFDGVEGEELEGASLDFGAQVFEVGRVLPQGLQALLPVARYIYAVGGVGRAEDGHEAYPVPWFQTIVQQFREDPSVGGIPGGVEDRNPHMPVVGLVQVPGGELQVMTQRKNDVRPVLANGAG